MSTKIDSVECPACCKRVVADLIEQHLDRCPEVRDESADPPLKKAKVSPVQSAHPFFHKKPQKSDTLLSEPALGRPRPTSPKASTSSSENVPIPRKIEPVAGKKGKAAAKPLAEIMRPSSLKDFVGQEEAIGEKTLLRRLMDTPNLLSLILWGPPGCGKTTLAHIISEKRRAEGDRFVSLSAVEAGIKDVKDAVGKAKADQSMFGVKTILFLDEIHRFNKAQQDVFLPFIEKGVITLIGATTENPSFSLNSALLSRCKVIVLEKLSSENIRTILHRALNNVKVEIVDSDDYSAPSEGVSITNSAVEFLVGVSDGDCRTALNSLQAAVDGYRGLKNHIVTEDDIKNSLKKTHFLYDRKGDQHYDTISAYHKSMRYSKPNAALYYLARMLHGGEDPRFIARRLIVFASEDIGLADPNMLSLAIATHQACEKIGMPECRINLSHCTVQFSRSPKSRETYNAYGRAEAFLRDFNGPHPPVPLAIRNAPTKLMKDLGYSSGDPGSCLPEGFEHLNFFEGPPPKHLK